MEDFVAVSDLHCADLAQEVSVQKNFSMWPTDCSCDILVKIVAAHALVQRKKVPVAKLKDFGLISWQKKSQNSLILTLLCSY